MVIKYNIKQSLKFLNSCTSQIFWVCFTVVFQICDREPAHFPDRMQEDLVSPGEKPSSSVLSEVGRGEGCIRGWRVYSVRVTCAVHCNSLTPWSSTEKSKKFWLFWILPDTLFWFIDCFGFYAVSAIFQPCNCGTVLMLWRYEQYVHSNTIKINFWMIIKITLKVIPVRNFYLLQ